MPRQPSSSEILSKVQVAKPCPADWREMRGTERVRHCEHCDHKVYDISAMSRDEAADLILKSGGKLCVRYYTRPDGKIMTKDCGKPLSNAKPLRLALIALTSALGLSYGLAATPKYPLDHNAPAWVSAIVDRMNALLGKKAPPAPTFTMGFISAPVRSIPAFIKAWPVENPPKKP